MKRMELDRKHQKWRKEARYRSSFNVSAQAEMAGHLVSGKLHDAIGWAVEGRTCSFHIMKYHKYINNIHNCPQSTYPFGTSSAKIRARWRRNSTTGAFLIWAQSIFGLNTRNKQLDYRVTEGEKFHDGWDLIWINLIWFDYYGTSFPTRLAMPHTLCCSKTQVHPYLEPGSTAAAHPLQYWVTRWVWVEEQWGATQAVIICPDDLPLFCFCKDVLLPRIACIAAYNIIYHHIHIKLL